LFICSPAAAPVGLVLQQGPGAMEEGRSRGLGEDCAFWVKRRRMKIGVLAERNCRYGRSAIQHG